MVAAAEWINGANPAKGRATGPAFTVRKRC
jgi:hypothetical protein